jgi:hexokinase
MRGPGAGLFDFLAGCVDSFFREHPPEDRREQALAFTFSFPVEQRSAASGTLIGWTKGFTATGVEGEDVVALLSGALERRGLGHLRIAVLTNDTVGTLLAGCYGDPSCDMGVILGTGTNACYPERTERIRNTFGAGFADEMIVNVEWGNFDRLETNRYDRMLDAASANPGRQHLEKMVSGMYLGEIARLAIREMAEAGLLFPGAGGSALLEPYSLATEQLVSPARGGETSFAGIGPAGASAEDRAAVREIGRLVAARSARIAGAAIAAVLTWMDPDLSARHAVAVDGSLFEGSPDYQSEITSTLQGLCGERADGIRLVLARDGSGIGSAIAGAVAASADRDGARAPKTS